MCNFRSDKGLSGMIIHMQNVSWISDRKYILQEINWTVKSGEHWAIIGLNGSGKTSLLNMVNGYIWPSKGGISILGKQFGQYDVRELRKKIGWVSSSLQERLYGNETAEEIVLSGKSATIGLYEKPNAKVLKRATLIMKQFKCDHLADQAYWTLSQGEKQKVLIARALISSPRLLIMDEPCAGLDIFAREQVLSLMEYIVGHDRSPTLIYVSHHLEEILPVFTHALLLRKGKIHSLGKTREVITRENLSDFFRMPVHVQWRNKRPWIRI
jgi:iron complex transport system ATP-binding protein